MGHIIIFDKEALFIIISRVSTYIKKKISKCNNLDCPRATLFSTLREGFC